MILFISNLAGPGKKYFLPTGDRFFRSTDFVSLANEDELLSVAKDVTGFEDVRGSEEEAGLLALAGVTVFNVGPDFRILYSESEGKPFAVFLKKKDFADLKLRMLGEWGKEFNKETQ